jgi:hypothetical protein
MQLSPTARWILGAVAVAVSTFGALIATDTVLAAELPRWVGVALAVAGPVLGFLLAPPQLGGTQQGLVNPALSEPPAADVAPERPDPAAGPRRRR